MTIEAWLLIAIIVLSVAGMLLEWNVLQLWHRVDELEEAEGDAEEE